MNAAHKSKINYTSGIVALVGVAVTMGWIPEAIKEQVIEITMIGGPILIGIFRTWFTEPE